MKKATARKLFSGSGMTEQEYRQHPGVNKSTLWAMRKSPAHYRFALENPSEDSQALKIGRAVHTAVLQPKEFDSFYAVAPTVDRRTKAGKEEYDRFAAEVGDKEVITSADSIEINALREAVKASPEAVALLEGCVMERPLFWQNSATGIDCKCRVDAMKPGIMIDLKTCQDASLDAFSREAFRLGYDVQAAHYCDAYYTISGEFPTWYFIAVEKAPPYAVNVIEADAGVIDFGFMRRDELLERLKVCRETDNWPGYGKSMLILPSYLEMG